MPLLLLFMFIKIKTLEGTELPLEVEKKMSVLEVKRLIEEKEAISVDQQRLIFAGKQLQNSNLLEIYNIKADDVLHMVLALRGG
jgi:Ubiquitin family